MNITLNPLRKAPDSLRRPSGEDPKDHLSSSGLSPLCFALPCLAELPAAAFLPAARSNRCTGLLPSCPQQSFRLPAKKSSRIKIHFPAAPGSYKKGTLPGAFLFGKDGPFRPAGMRAQIGNKGKESAPALCLVERAVSLDWKGCASDNPQKAGSAARALAAGQPKQAGLFAEKEEWSAVHSDVG